MDIRKVCCCTCYVVDSSVYRWRSLRAFEVDVRHRRCDEKMFKTSLKPIYIFFMKMSKLLSQSSSFLKIFYETPFSYDHDKFFSQKLFPFHRDSCMDTNLHCVIDSADSQMFTVAF